LWVGGKRSGKPKQVVDDFHDPHDGDIAAMVLHDIPRPLGYFEENAQSLLAGIRAQLVGKLSM
jgi:hypothetical protein